MRELIIDPAKHAQLVHIQDYIGQKEFVCKLCGSVNDWSVTKLYKQTIRGGKVQYRALCEDCDCYGPSLKTSLSEKIYWKGSYTDVGEFDTKLLSWMLKVGYIKNARVREFVVNHVNQRNDPEMASPTLNDERPLDVAEQRLIDRLLSARASLEEAEANVDELMQQLLAIAMKASYLEVRNVEDRLKGAKKNKDKLIGEVERAEIALKEYLA